MAREFDGSRSVITDVVQVPTLGCRRESRIPYCAGKMFAPGSSEIQAQNYDMPCPEPSAALILHQLAILAYDSKKIEVALRFMSMACAQPEAPALCHRNHAEMLHRCGRLHEAEAAARRAVQLDSNCVEAWDSLGTILFDQGALLESRDSYQAAVDIKPDFLPALNNLAVVLYKLAQFNASEACYRRALSLQPDNLEIQLNFANLLGELKRYREALEVAKRVLDGCPENNEFRRFVLEFMRSLVQVHPKRSQANSACCS